MGPSSRPWGRGIRLLFVDADLIGSRLMVSALKRSRDHFSVIAVARNLPEAMRETEQHEPHIAIIGTELEDGPGFRFLDHLCAFHPKTAPVMLLQDCERNTVLDAFRGGARGVFSRAQSVKTLSKCIRVVHGGQIWASNAHLEFILELLKESKPLQVVNQSRVSSLTKRERDLVRLVADGMRNREISSSLGLTEHTVRNYLFRIYNKLGISTRVELVLYALSQEQSQTQGQ